MPAMTRKLTETVVRRVPAPTAGQTMIWDQAVTGFAVRILPGGSRIFWFQYRTRGGRAGKNRMVRIGTWPTVSLAAARRAAKVLAGQVAHGQDPAAERQEAKRRDAARTAAPRCGKARTRRKAAAPGLALLFMPGNSGGIVGLRGARRAGARRAGLGLGLAALEILPQRSAQTALLAHLVRALSPLVHGCKTTTRRHATEASGAAGR